MCDPNISAWWLLFFPFWAAISFGYATWSVWYDLKRGRYVL